MNELENLKQSILREYPRLSADDHISFRCGADLACFNHCCADVNIFLTPYDVLRLRRAQGLGSASFLSRHTLIPFDKNQNLPLPLLKMNDSPTKECPFVDSERGCIVYADRPWPCRMYPMGVASPNEKIEAGQKFYFLMKEDFCLGLQEKRDLSVTEWVNDQGVLPYEEFGELFKQVTLNEAFAQGLKQSPQQVDMYWSALYDLDKFRKFIFNTSFVDRFELDAVEMDTLRDDDEALLRFGFRWLDMALFKKLSLKVKTEVLNRLSAKSTSTAANA